MPKFSDFIRAPGTAGPPTVQGIYALGFALRSEIPALFNKYLRVDAAQAFSSGEKLQGRTNLGLGTIATQDASAVAITGGAISGITDLAIADGGTGASTAASARTNLGLGNVDNTSDANKPVSTAAQTALNLKAPLASPLLTGTPTAPTAAPGTNTTQLATTAFVAAALAVTQPITKEFSSAQQTLTAGGALTLAHSMGAEPKIIELFIQCAAANLNYAVGDKVLIGFNTGGGANSRGISVVPDATNLNIRYSTGSDLIYIPDKTSGSVTAITIANWRLVVRAFA